MLKHHHEIHRTDRIGWLRAAVLGANDGIVSTASLIVGIAAANMDQAGIVLAGIAGLVGGAMSMGAGEYISVSSQSDTETADLALERDELERHPQHELKELAGIYVKRGLDAELAQQVAEQLTAHDALGAHARDELGITHALRARPLLAALASAAAFSVGGVLPLISAIIAPANVRVPVIMLSSLVFLAALGAVAARTGGAPMLRGAWRVVFWSALAMAVTAVVGYWFGGSAA